MGKRLFIAVDIDASTRDQIGRISMGLRAAMGHIHASWVLPDRMHLTLQFFGSADAALEERVRATLARPIAEAPFDLCLGGVGVFPERGSPTVLWLGVVGGLEQLRRLHAALPGRNFSPVLPQPANRPFTPHLTLARFRERAPRTKFAEITDIPASAGPSRIDRVTLYESRLSPAGPTYIPLAEALLHP